jgi:hypothetical protein
MSLINIAISAAVVVASIIPGYSPEFETANTTQTVSGTLTTTLSISVAVNGNDEGGAAHCTSFFNDTTFAKGNTAVSTCTRITFTSGNSAGANITIDASDNNYCGFMYIDDSSANNALDAGEKLLVGSGDAADITDPGNCDNVADVVDLDSPTDAAGSSLHARSEAIDIDASDQDSDAAGADCTDVGEYTSDYTDNSRTDHTATAGSFPTNYVAVNNDAAEIMNCSQAMYNASFFVEFKVYVPNTVPDGTYEETVTYTLTDN